MYYIYIYIQLAQAIKVHIVGTSLVLLSFHLFSPVHLFYLILFIYIFFNAANVGWSTVNYRQYLVFKHLYLCDGHCDQWLFQEIFFLLKLLLFLNSFEQS